MNKEFDLNGPVSFIHVRDHIEAKNDKVDKQGNILVKKGEMTVVSNGGATIAYIQDGNKVLFAVAKCNAMDVFSRFTGRAKARGRLLSAHYAKIIEIPVDAYRSHIRAALLDEYYSDLEQHVPDAPMRLY